MEANNNKPLWQVDTEYRKVVHAEGWVFLLKPFKNRFGWTAELIEGIKTNMLEEELASYLLRLQLEAVLLYKEVLELELKERLYGVEPEMKTAELTEEEKNSLAKEIYNNTIH